LSVALTLQTKISEVILMALQKCPKCELNYILDDQPYCTVCTKEMKGIDHHDDEGDICPICGERDAAFGEEYCTECLAEMKKLDSKQAVGEESIVEEAEQLDVIENIEDLPIDEEAEVVPPFELEHINEELSVEDEPFFDEEDEEILDEDEFPEDATESLSEDEDEEDD
jgi:hypothetical protein